MPKFSVIPWFSAPPVVHRSRQIARVLSGHGLGVIVDHAGLGPFAPLVRRHHVGSPGTELEFAL